MFGLEDKLVIFDISNTYFETRKPKSELAKYGRSKEKRSDCKQVVFTGVINAQGFIRHSRIYEGNKADSTTLPEMIADLKKYSNPNLDHTIVVDAGIASDDNLKLINEQGHKYVCVANKQIKDYEIGTSTISKLTDRGNNKVELSVFTPKGYNDTWMYVQSNAKRKKEESMDDKLKQRFEEGLIKIKKALSLKSGTKRIDKVWERIGRAKEKHKRVSGQYILEVTDENGKATNITWTKKESKVKDDKKNGVYFIRTNYKDPKEEELWDIYNTIREVESTFRCLKSDLQIRPVHHQNDQRIEAHIYLTILAYQLVNTIRYMLKEKEIHYNWKNIVRIMSTQTIQTIGFNTETKNIHIRKPSIPSKQVKEIYNATQCEQTQNSIKKYVVYH